MVWLESPANPTMTIVDIAEISKQVHAYRQEILIGVDNSCLSPVFQQPLELGADVVMYSLTKYHVGHGDVTMGSFSYNSDKLHEEMKKMQMCTLNISNVQYYSSVINSNLT